MSLAGFKLTSPQRTDETVWVVSGHPIAAAARWALSQRIQVDVWAVPFRYGDTTDLMAGCLLLGSFAPDGSVAA